MKDNTKHPLDEFLKKSLSDIEDTPSSGVWDSVVKDISSIPKPPLGKFFQLPRNVFFVSTGSSIFIMAALVTYLSGILQIRSSNGETRRGGTLQADHVEMPMTAKSEPEVVLSMSGGNAVDPVPAGLAKPEQNERITVKGSGSGPSNDQANRSGGQPPLQNITLPLSASSTLLAEKPLQDEKLPESSGTNETMGQQITNGTKNIEAPDYLASTDGRTITSLKNQTYFTSGLNERSTPDFRIRKKEYTQYYQPYGSLKISMYYLPEFGKGSLSGEERVNRNTLGLGLCMGKFGWQFESGMEVFRESIDRDYLLSYNRYLGKYRKLDSITFTTQGGAVVPHKHFTLVNVYDPDVTTTPLMEKVTVTTLRVPLLVGYVIPWHRFELAVKGGFMASYSFYGASGVLAVPERDRVLNLERKYTDPGEVNMEWKMALGLQYDINHKFSLQLEPGMTGPLNAGNGKKANRRFDNTYYGVKTGLLYRIK